MIQRVCLLSAHVFWLGWLILETRGERVGKSDQLVHSCCAPTTVGQVHGGNLASTSFEGLARRTGSDTMIRVGKVGLKLPPNSGELGRKDNK